MTCDFSLLTPFMTAFFGGPLPISAKAEFPIRTGAIANIGGTTTCHRPARRSRRSNFTNVSGGTIDGSGNVSGRVGHVNVNNTSRTPRPGSGTGATAVRTNHAGTAALTTFTSAATVTLTVTNSVRRSHSVTTRHVTVTTSRRAAAGRRVLRRPSPQPARSSWTGAARRGRRSGQHPEPRPLARQLHQPATNGATAYSWDFGDGSRPRRRQPALTRIPTLGVFTVTLTVTAPTGGTPVTRTALRHDGMCRAELREHATSAAPARGRRRASAERSTTTSHPATGAATNPPSPAERSTRQSPISGGTFVPATKVGSSVALRRRHPPQVQAVMHEQSAATRSRPGAGRVRPRPADPPAADLRDRRCRSLDLHVQHRLEFGPERGPGGDRQPVDLGHGHLRHEAATAWPTGCAIHSGLRLGITTTDVYVALSRLRRIRWRARAPRSIGCLAVVTGHGTFQPLTPIIGQLIGPIALSSTSKVPVERVCNNNPPPPHSPTVRSLATHVQIEAASASRGQVLVLFVAGFFAVIAGTAFVVDGGNAMAQQRDTQNGADAASEAGTVVIAQYLMGGSSATGATGTCRRARPTLGTSRSARPSTGRRPTTTSRSPAPSTRTSRATPDGAVAGARCRPARRACGVRAGASSTPTSRARSASTFTATTQATAVTGVVTTPVRRGLRLRPVPDHRAVRSVELRQHRQARCPASATWPFLGDDQTTPATRPSCRCARTRTMTSAADPLVRSAGSISRPRIGATTTGSCANNFKDAIQNPCIVSLPFPTWIQTFTGGVGKGGARVQDASTPTTTTSSRSRCSTGPARCSRPDDPRGL